MGPNQKVSLNIIYKYNLNVSNISKGNAIVAQLIAVAHIILSAENNKEIH